VCSTRSCRHPEASSNPQAGQLATQRRRPGGGRPAGRGLSAVWLLEWPSGVRQRGFIDYDSDAIRLRNPDALCRLT
jgi:hypothetical protein